MSDMSELEFVSRLIRAANAKLDVLDRTLQRSNDPTELAGLVATRKVILAERARCELASDRLANA